MNNWTSDLAPLLKGLAVTVELTVCAGVLAIPLGLLAGYARRSHNRFVRVPAACYAVSVITVVELLQEGKIIGSETMWRRKPNGHGFDVNQLRRVRAKVGMVFQQFNLFPHMTALDNLMIAPIHVLGMDRAAARERAMEYLEMVELSDKAQVYPGQLSGGQKQRVAIARALAMRPKIMLFDEITSALDPELVGGVLAILRKLSVRRTMTMLIVTHQMEFAERSADRVLFFDRGRVVEDGEAKAVFKSPAQERTKKFLEALVEPQV